MSMSRPPLPPASSASDFGGTQPDAAAVTNSGTFGALTSFGIQVGVRVRPFNKREITSSSGDGGLATPQSILELERDRKTFTLLDPTRNYAERATFTFDYCFSAFRPAIELEGLDPASPGSAGALTSRSDATQGGAVGGDSDDDEDGVAAERAQAEVYRSMGLPIVHAAWEGYNTCMFAYGQTSSGKTYTMMGTKRDPGVIPRVCKALFEKIENEIQQQIILQQIASIPASTPGVRPDSQESSFSASIAGSPITPAAPNSRKKITVTVSYMEIYNEQVKDLLKPRPKGQRPQFATRFDSRGVEDEYQSLKVRHHPLHGPFVEGITKTDAISWHDAVKLIRAGNENRSSCATDMNDSSSRSHAIFQLIVTQTEALGAKVRGKEVVNHKVSKINLVDLAGSERITKTQVTGKHITEANYINQSLSTLRKVIDVLVSRKKPGQTVVVPYRESLLTWILSDNFGGNSKTAMIAAVSPHSSNFQETESTLRYATLAKGIVNRIRVNEDPSAKLIRELQAQLKALQSEMNRGPQQERVRDLEEQMEENKTAMEELLAREEGMRILIQESRIREEQLRLEKETLEKDQQRWRKEAERLKREKEELKTQLRKVVAGESIDPSTTASFWGPQDAAKGNTGTANAAASSGTTPPQPSVPVESDDSCPPHQQHLLRRRSSMKLQPAELPNGSLAPQAESGAPSAAPTKEGDDAGTAAPPVAPAPRGRQPPAPFLDGDVMSPTKPSDGASAAPEQSVSPGPHARFGRRANTQEQGERTLGAGASTTEYGQVRTADVARAPRRRGAEGGDAVSNSATVPPSLAHLMPASQSTATVVSKSAASPDALDSFLTGGGAQDKPKRERGVPPWRQKRGTVNTANE